jgi:hypothetical protein
MSRREVASEQLHGGAAEFDGLREHSFACPRTGTKTS